MEAGRTGSLKNETRLKQSDPPNSRKACEIPRLTLDPAPSRLLRLRRGTAGRSGAVIVWLERLVATNNATTDKTAEKTPPFKSAVLLQKTNVAPLCGNWCRPGKTSNVCVCGGGERGLVEMKGGAWGIALGPHYL